MGHLLVAIGWVAAVCFYAEYDHTCKQEPFGEFLGLNCSSGAGRSW